MRTVTNNRAVWGWAIVAAAARVAWLCAVAPVAHWDGDIYARTALRIARGMGYVDTWNNLPPFKPTAFYPVGYPATLAIGNALFGPSVWVAGGLNVLAAAITTAMVVLLARATWRPPAQHLAGALVALSPGSVLYASTYMTETVAGAWLVAAVYLTATGRDGTHGGSVRSQWLTGICLGIGGLVRPQTLLLAPVLALLVGNGGLRRRTLAFARVGLACTMIVLPWTARNCIELDACALVSVNGGSNLWIGTDPEAHGGYRDLRPGEGCDHVHGEVAKDRCYGRLAVARIKNSPWQWLGLVPEKLEELLDGEFSPTEYLRTAGALSTQRAEIIQRIDTAAFRGLCALTLLALLPLAGRPKLNHTGWCALAAVLGNLVIHGVFFGADRYHFAFSPLMAVLAGGVVHPRNESCPDT